METISKRNRWDPSNVMGSKSLINIVTGARTFGKTYAMKKIMIKRFIDRGETSTVTRYFESNIKTMCDNGNYFGDIMINEEFKGWLIRNNGRRFEIARDEPKPKWQQFGMFSALTDVEGRKGKTPANMTLMVFDEFIKEKNVPPYPANTVELFYNMYESFDRRQNRVRAVLLGNTADIVNPFFRSWHISPIPKGTSRYFKVGNAHIYWENAYSKAFEEESRNTYLGALTEGSRYGQYATGNEFKNETGVFIGKKSAAAFCTWCFVWNGQKYAVWNDVYAGKLFINGRPNGDYEEVVLSKRDLGVNQILVGRSSPMLKKIVKLYGYGDVLFDNDQRREGFMEILSWCGIR